jgi:hypothetical protein
MFGKHIVGRPNQALELRAPTQEDVRRYLSWSESKEVLLPLESDLGSAELFASTDPLQFLADCKDRIWSVYHRETFLGMAWLHCKRPFYFAGINPLRGTEGYTKEKMVAEVLEEVAARLQSQGDTWDQVLFFAPNDDSIIRASEAAGLRMVTPPFGIPAVSATREFVFCCLEPFRYKWHYRSH